MDRDQIAGADRGGPDTGRFWLWVTTPEFYAEADGSDRQDLDPGFQSDPGGWWTCHRDTKLGDLILLYRTKPRMDFGYLIQAASDAYSIAEADIANERGWDYGCDYKVLHRFTQPLTLVDLRADSEMKDWGAYRANFQGRVYSIPSPTWYRLTDTMREREPEVTRLLCPEGAESLRMVFLREQELEDLLADDPSILQRFGYNLEVQDRQRICRGHGGRLDLLCYDRKKKKQVVIELKVVEAGRNTFGQIASYLGWLDKQSPRWWHRAARWRRAEGLVIARGCNSQFMSALATTSRVKFIDLGDLEAYVAEGRDLR